MKRLLLLFAAMCCMAMMQAEIVHHTQCDPTYLTVGYTQECWEDTETGKLYAEEGCTTELNRAIVVMYKKLLENPVVNLNMWTVNGSSDRADDHVKVSQNENEILDDCTFCWNAKIEYNNSGPYFSNIYASAEFKAFGTDIANARLKCFWKSYALSEGLVTGNDDGNFILKIKIGDQVVYVKENSQPQSWRDMPHVFEVPLPGLKTDDVVTFEMSKKIKCTSPGEYSACLEYTSTNGGDPDAAVITTDDKRKFKGTDDPELTYIVTPSSLAEKVSGINLSRDPGEEPGIYTIHASLAEGANPDRDIFFYDGKLEIVDGVHHEKGDKNTSGLIYLQDCWEETATGKYYADGYLEHELKSESVIGYIKLPSNPVTATDGFTVKESATYDGVLLDWVAEATYNDSGTRWVEFTVIDAPNANTARLVWYISSMSGPYYGYRNFKIYQNGDEVYSESQEVGGGANGAAGVFFVNLPKLNMGDKIRFELRWDARKSLPTVAACLQYVYPQELYLMAQEAGSTVQLNKVGNPYDTSLEYSTTGTKWQPYTFGQTITLANEGDRVYFRNASEDLAKGFSKGFNDYYQFVMTGSIAASGNVMSLIDKTCETTTFPAESVGTFACLFSGCKSLTSAPKLPATELTANCYYWMFNGCTGLTSAPELPATTLASGCYTAMFDNCTGLKQAPALPANTMEVNCYFAMFRGCTSLTEAPELSAMTLADGCYNEMFSGCTSLKIAPKLPATTLKMQCYYKMFNGCTSLTTAPELSATTLTSQCYEQMFSGCTNLTTAPELPATTLANRCYDRMFSGCTKLNQIKVDFTKWGNMEINYETDYNATIDWLSDVASTGTFVCPDALDKSQTGASYIPEGWTPVYEVKANNEPETENYYATFYSKENAYQVPNGVTAYTGVVEESASNPDESVLKLTAIEGGIIPAEEPVILKATKSQVYLPYTTETAINNPDNKLEGTDVATTLGASDYALSLGQNGVGFYLWEGKSIGAHKAYLTLESPTMAKAFTFQFEDGETTGILKPVMDEKKDSPAYNLNGVRVNDSYKGIVIKNGKKIYQK